jgi:hypothetical protein
MQDSAIPRPGRLSGRLAALFVGAVLAMAAIAPASVGASPGRGHALGSMSDTRIHNVGVGRIAKASKAAPDADEGSNPETGPREEELDAQVSGSKSAQRVPASHVPAPAGQSVTGAAGAAGFDGLSHRDQRTAGTGAYANTNFSTEPPDQALCVGNGYVVEGVNSAIGVYSPSGALLAGPTPLNQLYGVAPEIIRATPLVFGDFVGDVKCYFDPTTGRFFVTAFDVPTDPEDGAFVDEAHVKLAVSKSGDPTGDWWVYDLDVTNGDGTLANHPNCPCFGDQPLIGADAYAFFITTNEYSLEPFGAFFNGAQVYAFSKAQLAAGPSGSVTGLHFDGIPLAESIAYTIQPQTTPPGGAYDLRQGGTAYALSALDFDATLDDRIAVWAMTGTSTIGTTNQVAAYVHVLNSQVYGQPPDAEQRDGPTPLGDALKTDPTISGFTSNEHLESLAGNDDRMQQTVYADGKLWSNLNTVVKTSNGNTQIGTAWFVVEPSWSNGDIDGTIVNQGYVSVNRANILYGSIAVNAVGDAAMGVTLVGASTYPSAAWVSLSDSGPSSAVHVSGAGLGPEDGFSGYRNPGFAGNGTARWGDYSAAVADEAGHLWLANEYIGSERTLLANWGTFVTSVSP